MRVLILCTGNSCRSQMAHGFLQSFDDGLMVFSAGTRPASGINPLAVRVMSEAGIDISRHTPEDVTRYLDKEWDFVITVCDDAKETCPVFPGNVKHRLHLGFEDPSNATGSEEYIINEFRKTRDEIKTAFARLYNDTLIRYE